MQKTIATRVPVELQEQITKFMNEEGLDKSTPIRRIPEIGVGEWKKRRTVDLCRSGKVTLWKASQIWGVPLREMLEELNRLRITVNVAAKDIEEDVEDPKKAEA